jgi:DNA repair protein SbcC/Rad50
MILKSLRLENIRSYLQQTIDFPMGTTLFEGDIGSGKSTILMAIEFALFGLGSEKGGALLKTGAKKGLVTLCFEVEGKEYEACRSLQRKAKGVQQADCSLKMDGSVLHLSASEMKEKILEILAFNEPPDPKAGSVIFRYAIFTPQEEMKAIIWMRADQRLQTLRKAFRIEDYRVAMENSSTLARSIKDKSNRLSAHAADLESCREKWKVKSAEMRKYGEELARLNGEKTELDEKVAVLRERVETLRKSKESLGKAAGEVPHLEREIREKSGEIASLDSEVKELTLEIDQLQPEIEALATVQRPTEKTEDELKEELKLLRGRERELGTVQGVIIAKIGDYESVERNRVCPTCDRPAEPKEFEEKIKVKKEESQKAIDECVECRVKIDELDGLIDALRQYREGQNRLQMRNEQLQSKSERIEKNREKVRVLKEQVGQQEERLVKAQREIEEFDKLSVETEQFSRELRSRELELTKIGNKVSSFEATRVSLVNQVEELEKEIQSKEKERKASERLKEYVMWLEGYLMPTLEAIEKQVMMNINQEFNQHFQKWWGMLVEDPSKESRIDEEFTPLVEQDGYEQDYNYLSGGEKTSLALAYRLSLNTIVQKVSAGIKSNLLILDEPTDGFSKEQLFKIREILDELKCPQVVMVSHEKELESFAHQVMRIEKKNGISQIRPI